MAIAAVDTPANCHQQRKKFIELVGKHVLSEIASRIKESLYYSISLNLTPDEDHI